MWRSCAREAEKSTDLQPCQGKKGRSLPAAGALGAQVEAPRQPLRKLEPDVPAASLAGSCLFPERLGSQKADSECQGSWPSLCSLLEASSAAEVNPEPLGVSQVCWASQQGRRCAPDPQCWPQFSSESINLPMICAAKGRFLGGGFDRRRSQPHSPLSRCASEPEALCRVIPAGQLGTELPLSRGGPLWWSWKAAAHKQEKIRVPGFCRENYDSCTYFTNNGKENQLKFDNRRLKRKS